jgi:integrase
MNSTHITMQTHAANYLNERRSLGFALRSPGYSITSFARYVDALNPQRPLTVEVMADWARRDKGRSNNPTTWARRLLKLRPFTRYLQQFDPRIEMPDDTVFGGIGQRLAPHIYSEEEIIDLLAAARDLGPSGDLRSATYETLFGLIASTGIRVSEAVHLRNTEVDLRQGMLTIRQTKFSKSRYVPLHSSTVEALKQYRSLRNPQIEVTDETPFFVSTRGRRLGQQLSLRQVHRIFSSLRDQLGWVNRGAHDALRIHDLSYPNLNKIQTFFKNA